MTQRHHESIDALLKHDAVPEGHRVYKVKSVGGQTHFVVSNSPAQAAMAVCEVKAMTQKELLDEYRRVFPPKLDEHKGPAVGEQKGAVK